MGKKKWNGKELRVHIKTGYTDLRGTEIKLTTGLIAMLIRQAFEQPIVYVKELPQKRRKK